MHFVGGQVRVELSDIFADGAMHPFVKGAHPIGDEIAMIGQCP